ncbi:MAG: hypothetical protein WBQ76_15145 [Candidatus Korobacteraceae bacterium]
MYKKVKASEVPKRRRVSTSRFEVTEEWRLMKADIDRGLKPQEALQVILTTEDKKRYKIRNRRTVARFVKKYLDSRGLKYRVDSFGRDGRDFIVLKHQPVLPPVRSMLTTGD